MAGVMPPSAAATASTTGRAPPAGGRSPAAPDGGRRRRDDARRLLRPMARLAGASGGACGGAWPGSSMRRRMLGGTHPSRGRRRARRARRPRARGSSAVGCRRPPAGLSADRRRRVSPTRLATSARTVLGSRRAARPSGSASRHAALRPAASARSLGRAAGLGGRLHQRRPLDAAGRASVGAAGLGGSRRARGPSCRRRCSWPWPTSPPAPRRCRPWAARCHAAWRSRSTNWRATISSTCSRRSSARCRGSS